VHVIWCSMDLPAGTGELARACDDESPTSSIVVSRRMSEVFGTSESSESGSVLCDEERTTAGGGSGLPTRDTDGNVELVEERSRKSCPSDVSQRSFHPVLVVLDEAHCKARAGGG
jgi:hypothetical protein